MPVPANPKTQETAAYLKYPVVLSNSAWLSAVYLENPNRVGEMSLRAWPVWCKRHGTS
jgi:hypothetical protein